MNLDDKGFTSSDITKINYFINKYKQEITIIKQDNNIHCILSNLSNCINTNMTYISSEKNLVKKINNTYKNIPHTI